MGIIIIMDLLKIILKAKYIFKILCMIVIGYYYVEQAKIPQTACHLHTPSFGKQFSFFGTGDK